MDETKVRSVIEPPIADMTDHRTSKMVTKKYHKEYGRLCPRCKKRMKLSLPHGGLGMRSWRCEDRNRPGPAEDAGHRPAAAFSRDQAAPPQIKPPASRRMRRRLMITSRLDRVRARSVVSARLTCAGLCGIGGGLRSSASVHRTRNRCAIGVRSAGTVAYGVSSSLFHCLRSRRNAARFGAGLTALSFRVLSSRAADRKCKGTGTCENNLLHWMAPVVSCRTANGENPLMFRNVEALS